MHNINMVCVKIIKSFLVVCTLLYIKQLQKYARSAHNICVHSYQASTATVSIQTYIVYSPSVLFYSSKFSIICYMILFGWFGTAKATIIKNVIWHFFAVAVLSQPQHNHTLWELMDRNKIVYSEFLVCNIGFILFTNCSKCDHEWARSKFYVWP